MQFPKLQCTVLDFLISSITVLIRSEKKRVMLSKYWENNIIECTSNQIKKHQQMSSGSYEKCT